MQTSDSEACIKENQVNSFAVVFAKYREYLLEVKDSVVETVELAQEGSISEDEALPFLDECEQEIEEIQDCIHTLHHLWKQRGEHGD